jgi:hypothetical protein
MDKADPAAALRDGWRIREWRSSSLWRENAEDALEALPCLPLGGIARCKVCRRGGSAEIRVAMHWLHTGSQALARISWPLSFSFSV